MSGADIRALERRISALEREVSDLRAKCHALEVKSSHDTGPGMFLFGALILIWGLVLSAGVVKKHHDRDDLHGRIPPPTEIMPVPEAATGPSQ